MMFDRAVGLPKKPIKTIVPLVHNEKATLRSPLVHF